MKKYFLQCKGNAKYIVGQSEDGQWYDIFFHEKSGWQAWPEPISFKLTDLNEDRKEGWSVEELSDDDVFILLL